MRIYLKTNLKKVLIPYDHQHYLVGTIHKWLGKNNEHDNISLYSFSRLNGCKSTENGLLFEQGTSFFFSSINAEMIKRLITGIQRDPTMFYDLNVEELVVQEDPDLSDRTLFFLGSPIFIKRNIEDDSKHILFDESNANTCLIETLTSKLKFAGITPEKFSIEFDKLYPKAGTKKITYNGIENKANWCPVIIEGSNNIKQFAWNVGLGNSTGIGFGAIK